VPDDLHELIDVSPGSSVDILRARYEGAMKAATRSGNWRLAEKLTQAFDRLPRELRLAVYPGRERDAGRLEPPVTPRVAGARESKLAQREARSAAAFQRTGMRKPFRLLAYTVGILMLAVITMAGLQRAGLIPAHQRNQDPVPYYAPTGHTRPPQLVVVPAPPTTHIAPNLQVGSDGRIVVICQLTPGGSGTTSRVTPGTRVECADGADPQFDPGT
jgi:hypothetical protein